jgi:hypothetical protein
VPVYINPQLPRLDEATTIVRQRNHCRLLLFHVVSDFNRATMTTNTNQMNPMQHPLRATAAAIGAGIQGEARAPRVSHMQSANEGPADIIGKVSGAVAGGKRADDGLYFTNNEGIPFPDPYVSAHRAIIAFYVNNSC